MATLFTQFEWGVAHKEEILFFRPLMMKLDLDMAVYQVYKDVKGTQPYASPDYLKINSDFQYAPGKPLLVIGHPNDGLKKICRGTYTAPHNHRSTWFQFSNFALPGSSGSPILDEQGNWVGLLHRGLTPGFSKKGIQGLSMGSTIPPIVASLKEAHLDALEIFQVTDWLSERTKDSIVEKKLVGLYPEIPTTLNPYLNLHELTMLQLNLPLTSFTKDELLEGMQERQPNTCRLNIEIAKHEAFVGRLDDHEHLQGHLNACYELLHSELQIGAKLTNDELKIIADAVYTLCKEHTAESMAYKAYASYLATLTKRRVISTEEMLDQLQAKEKDLGVNQMNFAVADTLVSYDKENRTHAKEYLLTYKNKPQYPSYADDIVEGLVTIWKNWPADRPAVLDRLSDLVRDPEVTLEHALAAEVALYKLQGKK